jgi:hypothetical protein
MSIFLSHPESSTSKKPQKCRLVKLCTVGPYKLGTLPLTAISLYSVLLPRLIIEHELVVHPPKRVFDETAPKKHKVFVANLNEVVVFEAVSSFFRENPLFSSFLVEAWKPTSSKDRTSEQQINIITCNQYTSVPYIRKALHRYP